MWNSPMAKSRPAGLPRIVLYPLAAVGAVIVVCLAPSIAETLEEIVEHGVNRWREGREGKSSEA